MKNIRRILALTLVFVLSAAAVSTTAVLARGGGRMAHGQRHGITALCPNWDLAWCRYEEYGFCQRYEECELCQWPEQGRGRRIGQGHRQGPGQGLGCRRDNGGRWDCRWLR